MLCSVREAGQGLVEYAFILVLIAMVVFAGYCLSSVQSLATFSQN